MENRFSMAVFTNFAATLARQPAAASLAPRSNKTFVKSLFDLRFYSIYKRKHLVKSIFQLNCFQTEKFRQIGILFNLSSFIAFIYFLKFNSYVHCTYSIISKMAKSVLAHFWIHFTKKMYWSKNSVLRLTKEERNKLHAHKRRSWFLWRSQDRDRWLLRVMIIYICMMGMITGFLFSRKFTVLKNNTIIRKIM